MMRYMQSTGKHTPDDKFRVGLSAVPSTCSTESAPWKISGHQNTGKAVSNRLHFRSGCTMCCDKTTWFLTLPSVSSNRQPNSERSQHLFVIEKRQQRSFRPTRLTYVSEMLPICYGDASSSFALSLQLPQRQHTDMKTKQASRARFRSQQRPKNKTTLKVQAQSN